MLPKQVCICVTATEKSFSQYVCVIVLKNFVCKSVFVCYCY